MTEQDDPKGDGQGSLKARDSAPSPVQARFDVPEIFMDGYRNVTLQDFVIRMNVTANCPSPDDPTMVPYLVGRLVIPLLAFLRIYESFGSVIRELEERGMIAKAEEERSS